MGRPLVLLLLLLLLLQHFGDGDGSQTLAQTPLQFTRFQYNVTVHENSAAKTYVGHPVKMGIYLTNPLWELRYKIVSGDNENLFKAEEYILGDFCFLRIRTKGGNTAILNREVKDHYTLIVKAIEKNSNAEARAKVRVQVLDTNDLRPLFSPTSYSVSLPENTAIRTSVARVSATDADIGTNGEFYYSFKDRTDMFAIHPTSGAVVLTGRLDYAETKLYEMEILAVDRGMKLYGSSGISSMAKLTVHVEQANRCAPVITAVTLSPSELDKDPTYAIITVDDCDQGPNGEIASLSIVAGDLLQQFRTVRSSPGSKEYKVKAVGAIDWDSHPFGYSLTLQAKDKGTPPQFSSVKVIRVTSPQFKAGPVKFEKDVYRAEISEFAPSNTPVVMVKATPSYSHLRYVFKSTPGKAKFSLNHNTGLISILEPVKRQQASHFELEVTTSDRIASTRVLVKVLSANSNPPEFTQTAYKASFDENVPIGTTVMSATAIDPDDGENGYVTYSIANLNHVPFVINHFTGAVSTSEDLDYELMPRVYTLRIRASDWGLPYRREVEVLATVTLNNLNDNTPLFEKINCEGTIPRDLGVGEQITTVSAIDADELQLVRYQIEAGNELDLFSLNPNSGVLSLKQSLMDGLGTRVSFHSLRITATDGENFATPLYINLTVAATRKPVHLQCEETGVAKMLAEELLQAGVAAVEHGAAQHGHVLRGKAGAQVGMELVQVGGVRDDEERVLAVPHLEHQAQLRHEEAELGEVAVGEAEDEAQGRQDVLAAAPRLLVRDLEDGDAEVGEHEAGGELADAALHVDQEAPQHLEDADVLQQEVLVCAQGPLQGQALLLAVLLLLLLLLFLPLATLLLFLRIWGPHFEVAVLSGVLLVIIVILALLALGLLPLVGGLDPGGQLPLNGLPDECAQALDEVLVGGRVADTGEGQEDDLARPGHHLNLRLRMLRAHTANSSRYVP